jgi:thioesterase domain-containing protein
MLLDAGWTGDNALTAICGGETMPRPLAEALLAQCARVFNAYGPTETTIWSTIERVRSGSGPVPIGRPLANNRLYILDPRLEPVPVGVAGHLYIGGAGVAQGYWRRPQLTAERFLPDPFAATPSARMYNTGDLARWLPGGAVEFLGRSDHQVKLRGFRIELGEVEAALLAHSGVQAAAVLLRDDALFAWCVWRNEPVDSGSLRQFLALRLPAYMLPARFIGLPALPALPNGKVDRKALSSLVQPPQSAPAAVAPASETERRIAAIWEELLKCGPIGRSDDFFELGGNSLLAARAAARIDQAFGIRVPIAAVFEASTVAALTGHILSGAQRAWPPRIIPIQPGGMRLPFWAVGGAASFRALAQHLGDDQPVLGILLEESDVAKFRPPYTVEEISGEIVRLLRRQQPHGPYYLTGHSRYGVFALETARQLLALGEEVPLLAILDAYLPKAARMSFPLGVRARIHIAATSWLLERGRYREAVAFILNTGIDLATRRFRAGSEAAVNPSASITQALSITQVLDLAAATYQPPPYSERIVYLQAADQPIALELGSRLGWSDWTVRGFDVRHVPGTHTTLLEPPHVAAVALALADFLPQPSILCRAPLTVAAMAITTESQSR